MKYLKKWYSFNEAIVDLPSMTLSDIFTENGKMKTEVRKNIDKGIKIISEQFPELKIIDIYVVGAAITYQYEDSSDIDVTVVLDPSTPKDLMSKVDKWIEVNLDKGKYSMKYGKRPYQFKVSFSGRDNVDTADSVYDSVADVWIKKPSQKQSIDMWQKKVLDDESEEHNTYSEMEKMVQPSLKKLYKGLINGVSTNELSNMIKFAFSKYGDITKIDPSFDIEKKKQAYIKNIRGSAYQNEVEPGYVSKNWGLGNVVYKMFDREKYTDVYEILKDIIKYNKFEDDSILNDLKFKLEEVINDEIGYEPDPTTIKSFQDLHPLKK